MHEALREGNVAVVTGGASGIGHEIAERLLGLGMKVAVIDRPEALRPRMPATLAIGADVSRASELIEAKARIAAELGPVSALFANAGIQPGSSIFDAEETWKRIIDVNLWGVVNAVQVFTPEMVVSRQPGLVVITGSKQGITTPPGDPAYNVSKAGVKAFAEALQHELRGIGENAVEARLFIPGWVHTPLTARGRSEKPEGAWTPEQVVDFLMRELDGESFYILCPDNDVDRATDEKRILWAAGDIVENRPPLSRWHPDWGERFKASLKG